MSVKFRSIVRIGDKVQRTAPPLKGRKGTVVGGPSKIGNYEIELPSGRKCFFWWHPGNFIITQTAKPNWEI